VEAQETTKLQTKALRFLSISKKAANFIGKLISKQLRNQVFGSIREQQVEGFIVKHETSSL
jgi:hypothetical protein